MNALDRLRQMLDEAGIRYESYCKTHEDMKKEYPEWVIPIVECEADRYFKNQIVYGRKEYNNRWLFDAIFKHGSYGRFGNLLETYGEYGQKNGNPMVMSAEEAFDVIKSLYDNKQF